MKKNCILFIIMGSIYMNIEIIFKAIRNLIFDYNFSLIGDTSIYMFIVGGLCSLIIGRLNEECVCKIFKNKITYTKLNSIVKQSIIGTLIILFLEFISGMILNIVFNFDIWDYSDLPFNLYGQVSLLFGVFWFLLCPLCIWVDDVFRYVLFDDDKPDKLLNIYLKLLKFK